MKIRVLHDFRDKTADLQLRRKGETLEVSKDRAAALVRMGLAAALGKDRKGES